MEKYLRYTDETSDKYWEIVYQDTSMTVFFGKTGTAGRVEEKTFATAIACSKEAEKLIASKIRKGYKESNESNRIIKEAATLLEIKEFEEQWDIKVSPVSKKLMNESFFWSCIEETSPFGSDEGSDTFDSLKNSYDENPGMKAIDFLLEVLEDTSLYPLRDLNCTDSDTIEAALEESKLDYVIIQDSAIWATAFGQLVMKGKIDEELKIIATHSLKRQCLPLFTDLHGDENRLLHIEKMQRVLQGL